MFVVFIEAIIITVANPALRYTMTGPRTSILEVSAGHLLATVTFVGTIPAIIFGIALPTIRDTTPVRAAEMRITTSHVRTIHFVAVIATIILVIAFERFRDTSLILALEFGHAARGY